MHAHKGAGPKASMQAGRLALIGTLQLWLVCMGALYREQAPVSCPASPGALDQSGHDTLGSTTLWQTNSKVADPVRDAHFGAGACTTCDEVSSRLGEEA